MTFCGAPPAACRSAAALAFSIAASTRKCWSCACTRRSSTYQKLPDPIDPDTIWDERLESIREQEQHLARNGTVILKFWLNVSKDEQKRRFLSRLDDPAKNWKFEPGDVVERRHWDDYMQAYEEALNATSRPWAPWYAIPADDKPYMRARVADIIIDALWSIGLEYPEPSAEERAEFAEAREELESEGDIT